MRRKAIIVTGITLMVTVMVAAFSYLYISQTFASELPMPTKAPAPHQATGLLRRK